MNKKYTKGNVYIQEYHKFEVSPEIKQMVQPFVGLFRSNWAYTVQSYFIANQFSIYFLLLNVQQITNLLYQKKYMQALSKLGQKGKFLTNHKKMKIKLQSYRDFKFMLCYVLNLYFLS